MSEQEGSKFIILTENPADASHVSIYHDYMYTPLKMEASTIEKVVEKGHYIDNMCWVNALTNLHRETMMNVETKQRLTVDRIVEF